MMSKKRYFPNNWRAIKKAPVEFFESIEYEDFMDWKIHGWQLPETVIALVREEDAETGKVKEYVYHREHAVNQRLAKSMDAGNTVMMCTDTRMHFFQPEEDYDDYEDD